MLGSVGLFLYGMSILSEGLQNAAGNKLEKMLALMTKNKTRGIITGAVVSAAIHSSAAVTVMVVGFANAEIFTLTQAVSVILGANIGTTFTAWIVSLFGSQFKMLGFALFIFATTLVFQFTDSEKTKETVKILCGTALFMIGLSFLQDAIPVQSANIGSLKFLSYLKDSDLFSLLICFVTGMIATAILQSSTAAMTITIALASSGWIGIYGSCVLCLGQNVGTTVTALLASSRASSNAKRAAMAHLLFNLIGSLVAFVFIHPLLKLISVFTFTNILSLSGAELNSKLPYFLSAFHTTFNVLNTLMFYPFISKFAAFIERIVPKKEEEIQKKQKYQLNFIIKDSFITVPDVYFTLLRQEISKLSNLSLDMINTFSDMLVNQDDNPSDQLKIMKENEDYADDIQEELTKFCVKIINESISFKHINMLTSFVRIIDEFESITDSCYALACDAAKRYEKKCVFDNQTLEKVVSYLSISKHYLEYINDHVMGGFNNDNLMRSYNFENELNSGRTQLVRFVERRMEQTDNITSDLIVFDMTRHIEHIGDFCTNIAQSFIRYA